MRGSSRTRTLDAQLAASERLAFVLRRAGLGANPLAWRLPPIETWPAAVAFVQTAAGRCVLFASFALLAKLVEGGLWQHGIWLQLTASAMLESICRP